MNAQSENPFKTCDDLPSVLQETVGQLLEDAVIDQATIDQIMRLIETGERRKYELSSNARSNQSD